MSENPNLCDLNCGECGAVGNRQLSLLLNFLRQRFGDEVEVIVNKFCPNLSSCPDCGSDDFCHEEGCAVEKRTAEEIREYSSPTERFLEDVKRQFKKYLPDYRTETRLSAQGETGLWQVVVFDVPAEEVGVVDDMARAVCDRCMEECPVWGLNLMYLIVPRSAMKGTRES